MKVKTQLKRNSPLETEKEEKPLKKTKINIGSSLEEYSFILGDQEDAISSGRVNQHKPTGITFYGRVVEKPILKQKKKVKQKKKLKQKRKVNQKKPVIPKSTLTLKSKRLYADIIYAECKEILIKKIPNPNPENPDNFGYAQTILMGQGIYDKKVINIIFNKYLDERIEFHLENEQKALFEKAKLISVSGR